MLDRVRSGHPPWLTEWAPRGTLVLHPPHNPRSETPWIATTSPSGESSRAERR
jgi:hypothetical protein